MAIIHQHDKRSGITYAYESHSYWDPEKKMVRAKRKLIGRVNPETGEITPTDGRGRKPSKEKRAVTGKNPDYKEAYEKLLQKYESQQILLESLTKELSKYKSER